MWTWAGGRCFPGNHCGLYPACVEDGQVRNAWDSRYLTGSGREGEVPAVRNAARAPVRRGEAVQGRHRRGHAQAGPTAQRLAAPKLETAVQGPGRGGRHMRSPRLRSSIGAGREGATTSTAAVATLLLSAETEAVYAGDPGTRNMGAAADVRLHDGLAAWALGRAIGVSRCLRKPWGTTVG